MQRQHNWNNIQEEVFVEVEPGYHAFTIDKAEWKQSASGVNYLAIELKNDDGGKVFHNISYNEQRPGFFKKDINRIEQVNAPWIFDFTDSSLLGKTVLAVICQEEFEKSDGEIVIYPRVQTLVNMTEYNDKKITIKPLKKLKITKRDIDARTTQDEDLPF